MRREDVAYCVKVFLALRLGLLLIGLVGVGLLPNAAGIPGAEDLGIPGPVGVPGWAAGGITQGWHNLFTSFERFDALWFLRIADTGYDAGDGSAAFFPLYPMLVRAVSWAIGGHPLTAGLLVSNAAFLGALCVLHGLTAEEISPAAARTTVLLVAVFPTSFFFLAPYSESLFLLLAVGSYWAARRGRWPIAGGLGALATATRSIGVVLVAALLAEALHQYRQRRGRLVGPLAWSLASSAGALAYLAYWRISSGGWLTPFGLQAQWERVGDFPWVTLWHATRAALRWPGLYPAGYHQIDWLIVVPVLGLAGYGVTRLRPSALVYLWGSLLVPLAMAFPSRPLMSVPRFALTMFPVFWVLALLTERPGVRRAVVAASAGGLGLLTLLFVNWYYIF